MIQKLSVTEYAKLRGISRPAVIKAINKGHNMPGVTSFEKIGNTYVLYVDMDLFKK